MIDAAVPASPSLTDGRLMLRPWRDADAAELHAAVCESIGSVGRWLPWCNADYGLEQAEAWSAQCGDNWRSGEQFAFAVRDAASGELLGGCGLNRPDPVHRSANLGYWVRTSRQGRGVAVAAARLVAGFGFEELGLARIEIVTQLGNWASRRTAEKIGACLEAVEHRRLPAMGEAVEVAVYALASADREPRVATPA